MDLNCRSMTVVSEYVVNHMQSCFHSLPITVRTHLLPILVLNPATKGLRRVLKEKRQDENTGNRSFLKSAKEATDDPLNNSKICRAIKLLNHFLANKMNGILDGHINDI